MVFEIVCNNCGTPLYSGIEIRSARDVLKAHRGRCKKCGLSLSSTDFMIEVKSMSG